MWVCIGVMQGREPEVPELKVEELAVAVHRGTYNACVDLATQVRAKPASRAAAGIIDNAPPCHRSSFLELLGRSH